MPEIGTYIVKGKGTPEERLRVIKDAGFDFVCLTVPGIASGATPELCDRVGIPFDNVHLTGGKTNLIWSPGDAGEAICDRYCREIAEMTELGLHTGIVHVTWGRSVIPEPPGEAGFRRYERIRETAGRCGFTVAVENSIFPEHFYSVLDRFDVPEFGYCFDCGHWNAFCPEHDFLGKYGHRLAATHLHDNDGARDMHILPFDGTLDWDALAAAFASTDYTRGRICAEFGGAHDVEMPGMTAEEIARATSSMKLSGDPAMKITDGLVSFYGGIPYEDLIGTLYSRMKRFAGMIDAAAAKNSASASMN